MNVTDLSEVERTRILAKAALFAPPPAQLADGRRELVGLSRAELAEALAGIGEKPFRAKQLWHWIYHQGVTDFALMSTIARPLQQRLAEHFVIGRPDAAQRQKSRDGTEKFLFRFRDGQQAETVYIPDVTEDRGSVCISSQVGCTLSCRFCHTGTQTLVRNLGAAEIVGQFMAARDAYSEWPSPKGETPRLLSTIVLMGMGEPLYNYENVAKAMTIVMDGEGIGLSRRRITLSTSGVVPMMDRCGAELGVNLAVSLHAVTDELRDQLVPLNRKYNLHDLLAACRRYPSASNARRITFEYVMLRDVNDSEAEARELVRLIAGLPAKVNLIPFNPWPGSAYEPSSPKVQAKFAAIVMDAGFSSPIRTPRGQDILAACGQLRTESETKRRILKEGQRMATKDVKKVVLAYSGGLDTSVILRWLQTTYGCEVVTFTADLGQGEELEPARRKAELFGVKQIFIEDLRETFTRDFVFPMFRANALYEGQYLLGTSIARPLIAQRQIEIAEQVGADAVAHGATGKGNDQVRFELAYYALKPDVKVIAPWREWDLTSRTRLLEFAEANQIPIARDKRGGRAVQCRRQFVAFLV